MDASLTTGELKRALRELVREEPDFLASLLREAGAISTPPPVRETPARSRMGRDKH
ncbi:MAG: hypothetical protein HC910_14680 [Spirulinaceae cyanobacterium SM2_1_0]|nr:hypothetical protein [Spirulinaceae cyanobacterium SM2_1_0]